MAFGMRICHSSRTMFVRRAHCAFAIILLLSGCVTSGGYAPRAAFPIDDDIKQLHDTFDTKTTIVAYYAAGADNDQRRNEFVAGRLALYDLEFIRFISRFRLSRAEQNTAFDAVALGVGVATTITAGERAKTILGAVTTALTGARTSYEKNFYDDKTAAALVAQMTAERKKALIPIVQGLRQSARDYPLTTAIIDLTNYQLAGTVDGALGGIQQDAAAKDEKATSTLNLYRSSSYAPDNNTARLRTWLYTVDAAGNYSLNKDREALLRDKLPPELSGIALQNFLIDAKLAGIRATVVRDIPVP